MEVERIDDHGDMLGIYELTTRYLFLCAGAMASTSLLLRARERGDLPDLSSDVGEGFGSNGNAMFLRSGVNESTGTKQASPPVVALADLENPVRPMLIESSQFPLGFDCHCLLSLGVAAQDTRARFVYEAATDSVRLSWPKDGNAEARAAALSVVERLNDAAGGILDKDFLPTGVTDSFTYHPLGGAVVGKATDFYGRVKGYPGLYVIDGSLIPGSTQTANPSLTIAALAERNIADILAKDFLVG